MQFERQYRNFVHLIVDELVSDAGAAVHVQDCRDRCPRASRRLQALSLETQALSCKSRTRGAYVCQNARESEGPILING